MPPEATVSTTSFTVASKWFLMCLKSAKGLCVRARCRRGTRKRARWVVVKRRRAVTRDAVTGVDGGDPPGTSLASCLIA